MFDRKKKTKLCKAIILQQKKKKKPEGVRVKPISDSTQLLINP